MTSAIERLELLPAGRTASNTARKIVRMARRIANPDIPDGHQLSKVAFRGKEFAILHRRNYVDAAVIRQCFQQGQYDMPGGAHGLLADRLYEGIVASGRQPLIVDCGANIGASPLWFTARYPKAHVIAIEPAPDNFAFLRTNCAGMDVDARQAGISAEDGLAHLIDPGEGSWGYRTGSSGSGPEVPMLSLATLLAAKPEALYVPFILKIDIEGAETALFDRDCSAVGRFPIIIMEPHDWLLPGQNSSLGFFRFHAAAGREFCVKNENIASIAFDNLSMNA